MARGICDDLTVVELATGSIASSLAGMILADNGARVLKVEPPAGDRLRESNPSGFLVWNRGKESVALDLKSHGRRTALDLAASADVVLEAFAPGVADRLDLGYDDLSPLNPGLVYCSIKGFGSTGAYAALKGYDAVVTAKAGILTPGGYTGRRPAREGPVSVGVPIASVGAAHQAVGGILAALLVRERSGRGQLVEASLLQGLNPYDYFGTMLWQHSPGPREGITDAAGLTRARPPALMCAADGRWIVQSSTLLHQLKSLIRVLGLDWIWDDPRFSSTPHLLPEHVPAFQDLFWEAFRSRPLAEWLPILLAEPDIAFEVAGSSEASLDHPQMRHNGNVIEVEDPFVGAIQQVGPIAAFDRTPSRIARSAPMLGQHAALPLTGKAALAPLRAVPNEAPLAGVTIVEFGYFYAMPFAMTMAAALGARVIKVEDLRGDPVRWSYGPPEASGAKVMEGKESVAVDVRTPEGARIVRDLVARADVFALGFRPGVAKRLGIDYESLRAINPRLVYLWSTGYGHTGPYSHRPMYASTASAIAGCYHRQAAPWLEPARSAGRDIEQLKKIASRLQPPVDGDANAALASFSTLLLALYDQERTGQGQFVATTMINGNAYAYADDFTRFDGKQPFAMLDDEQLGQDALHRVYPTQRGWVSLVVETQAEWERLIRAPGLGGLPNDRFATAAGRRAADAELAAALEDSLRSRPAQEWEKDLSALGVGCAEVFEGTMSDFWNTDVVLRETGMVFDVEHPLFGTVLRHGLPVKMSVSPGRVAPGCLVGQHTDLVLDELGYTAAEVDDFVDRGVVVRLHDREPMGGEHVHAV